MRLQPLVLLVDDLEDQRDLYRPDVIVMDPEARLAEIRRVMMPSAES